MQISIKRSIKLNVLATITALCLCRGASATPWVTAYYPTWTLSSPTPSNLDMRAITHLVFFSLTPTSTGGLTDTSGGLIAANASAVKTAAHNAGKKVLICIGGGGTASAFEGAISSTYRATFVSNIVSWVTTNGYDGVDIDMEPMSASDATDYEAFIGALRTALSGAGSGLLLTAAAEPYGVPSIFDAVQSDFDQINVMTYDLSGTWSGMTWHNSNLYTGGVTFPDNSPAPSCDQAVQSYINAGVSASKLSIGAAFYGYQWTYVTGPEQAFGGSTAVTAVSYADIMTSYYSSGTYHWDAVADAPWLGFQTTSPVAFISYDDPALCAAKVNYVENKGLGGLVCWNVGQDYIPSAPSGQQQPLLAAIYAGLNPTVTTDYLSDWSLVSAKSANWTLDGSNPTYFSGDTSRATRTADDTEYLVYAYPGITHFSARVYAWNGPIGDVGFLVSTDGGATYSAVGVTTGSKTITTSPWGYYTITNTNPLPANVTDLKVQFTATGNSWDPQLSQISITHT